MSRQPLLGWALIGVFLAAAIAFFVTRKHEAPAAGARASSTQQPPLQGSKPDRSAPLPPNQPSAYERAGNLLEAFEETQGKIDVRSLTFQAKALNECQILSTVPNYFANLETEDAKERYGDKLPTIKKYVSSYVNRCGDLAQVHRPSSADRSKAIAAAAAAGSPWARAEMFAKQSRTMSPADADAELKSILATRDPDAVSALADMMAMPHKDSQYSSLSGTPLHVYAWQLAGCDLGLDCTSSGELMRNACIFGGACGAAVDYRDLLRQSILSADDFSQVESLEASVLAAVRTSND